MKKELKKHATLMGIDINNDSWDSDDSETNRRRVIRTYDNCG